LRTRLADTWAEIKKITWPDGDTVRSLTALVIAMATVLGIILGGLDWILLKIFEAF
jgi:preprotein translocase SecE subunit